MSLEPREFTVKEQWARNAQTAIPPNPISGQAYRDANLTPEQMATGQAYNVVADSAVWNEGLYEATGMAREAEVYGVPRWSSATNYVGPGSTVTGSDGELYFSTQASGPDTAGGAQDPVSTTGYWQSFTDKAGGASSGGEVPAARRIDTTLPLTGGGDLSANRLLGVNAATETTVGVVERATDAEASAGTDTTRYITPRHLQVTKNALAPITRSINTTLPLVGGGDLTQDRTLSINQATETTVGVVERATDAEVATGADATRYVTPAQVAGRFNGRSILTTLPLTGGGDLSQDRTIGINAASTSAPGSIQIATSAEVLAGTNNEKAVSPAGLASFGRKTVLSSLRAAGSASISAPMSCNRIRVSGYVFIPISNIANSQTITLTIGGFGTIIRKKEGARGGDRGFGYDTTFYIPMDELVTANVTQGQNINISLSGTSTSTVGSPPNPVIGDARIFLDFFNQ